MDQQVKLKTISQLFDASASEATRASVLGLIVDCTAPHRKDAKRDYVMKIKIIDNTEQKQPCVVFIYGNNIQDFPKINEIGDILYLRKYQFQIWKDTHLQAKNLNKKIANQIVFSGQPESKSFDAIDLAYNQNLVSKEGNQILEALISLRKFSKEHFKKNKVPTVASTNSISSDFDLILRVVACEQFLNMFKVHLEDGKHKFSLNYREYVYDGIYKVRSIARVDWIQKQAILLGNDYTNFIRIPTWMKSHNEVQWQKISAAGLPHKRSQKPLSTVVGNKKLKVSSLKELISREQHPQQTLIQVQIIDIPNSSFQNCLRKYDPKNRTQKPYTSENGEYIYYMSFLVRDASLENSFMTLFLYTYDGKGLQFLPGLNPEHIYGTNILNYKQTFQNIKNKLLQQTSCQKPLQLLVSPMYGKNNTIYRIVDTKLIL